jgi:hypothetical protein
VLTVRKSQASVVAACLRKSQARLLAACARKNVRARVKSQDELHHARDLTPKAAGGHLLSALASGKRAPGAGVHAGD